MDGFDKALGFRVQTLILFAVDPSMDILVEGCEEETPSLIILPPGR